MKTLKTIVSGVLLYLCALSCMRMTPEPNPLSFLPGECLAGDELQLEKVTTGLSHNRLCVGADVQHYVTDFGFFTDTPDRRWRWPAGDAWQGIQNKTRVEEEYKRILRDLRADLSIRHIPLQRGMSVFHSGVNIVADKPFLGREPGENLFDLMFVDLNELFWANKNK